MPSLDGLVARLDRLGRVLLGYSGGVDSAFLAVVGVRALGPDRFLAVIGRSPSYPEVQYEAATRLARDFGVPLHELATQEMHDPRYLANPTDRCFFCKDELWSRLGALATARAFDAVVDGTNADDLGEHRPGLRAAAIHGVRSPLAELGWRKADIRAASRELGLPGWDAPAAPCLSSRVAYGLAITPERLAAVEQGEAWLRTQGVTGDLRVRHLGDTARLEVSSDQFGRITAAWPEVERRFAALGFARVELDPRGYRRGSLLQVLDGVGA
ncbi:MAG: ATP-dependent sacrificial sulfur transferase LarE [Gemmatimonadales bacterium]|nr:ATP-dependent sacrificial sulfur transferase LarE [Gemmatimonadales bacterium]